MGGNGSAVLPGPGPENIDFQPHESAVAEGEAVDVKVITKFYCPKCKAELIDTGIYNQSLTWIECDLCDKRTKDVISCRPCDFDLCRPCARKSAAGQTK
jgi:hypothetical protein